MGKKGKKADLQVQRTAAARPYHISFYWQSKLTPERKQEIIDFMSSLNPAQQELIEDWMMDQREEAEWDYAGRGS